ncbi:LytR/AlgR family response regulator transcription factor [Altibacter sp. HG106]|uniref:LytR/AlgR family response regulator transcription factor n=1 Tax=Altibacter sp. HG106 TaxID=3023937 RepID=UPI0023503CBF|nr:LytTR family DNA-binding domain-containing protein [Altibacter sp. HG106]MDC7994284.1 LytTR family DNA-binding domain-containing protein [Altibacter sp. HG106]
MIKALIIDDEPLFRNAIQEKVTQRFAHAIEIVGEASGVSQGLEAIATLNPELLFLDINMEDGTGFDLLEKTPSVSFDIIFITGYDQHAIKAIKAGALDYVLKPIDDFEFDEAVRKAIDTHKKEDQIEKLLEISGEYFRGVEKKRIILKTTDTVYAVYEEDILYCRSEGNYTTFYTLKGETIMVSKSLKQVEEIVSETTFVRCHQSYMVNKKHVLRYNKNGTLVVKRDFKVPVSSRRKDYTLARIFA